VLVLGLAGALASAGPARGPRFATGPELPVVPQVTGQVSDLIDTLALRPNLPGRNVITITVADTRRPALGPITGVSVILRSPDGVQTVHPVVRAADGGWAVTVDDIRAAGQWTVAVTVQRDGLAPVTDSHPWVVGSDQAAVEPTWSAAPLRTTMAWLAFAAGLIGLAAVGAARRRRRGPSGPAPAPDAPVEPGRSGPADLETGHTTDEDQHPAEPAAVQ
jgi:copper transport protein